VTADEALKAVRGLAAAGQVRFTRHARERMYQRNASERDVMNALVKARGCRASDGAWKVDGPDLDGDDLTVVVRLEDGVLVITVY
jgi:hypothetical protein